MMMRHARSGLPAERERASFRLVEEPAFLVEAMPGVGGRRRNADRVAAVEEGVDVVDEQRAARRRDVELEGEVEHDLELRPESVPHRGLSAPEDRREVRPVAAEQA